MSAAASMDLVVIPGNGIGPELVETALAVLDRGSSLHGLTVRTRTVPAGAAAYRRTGHACRRTPCHGSAPPTGCSRGPWGSPTCATRTGAEAGLLGGLLRRGLDTYANVRPIRLLPGVSGATRHKPGEIDYVVVRENTEGLYISRGSGAATPHAATDQLMVTRHGTERVVRRAFDLARRRSRTGSDGVRRVTCVDKSNVLRSYALFRAVFDEVAEQYPDIETTHLYADAAAHELVMGRQAFDVLVMENFLGDILSDLGAATAGGLGMCGSLNVGEDTANAEPIHGSGPDIAGRQQANPISQILSLALLLDHAGHAGVAADVRDAIEAALADHSVELTDRGTPVHGTASVTQAVCDHLRGPA